MKCNQCGASKVTVADIRACETCVRDGTVAQVGSVSNDMTLEDAIKVAPGLGNRFTPIERKAQRRSQKDRRRSAAEQPVVSVKRAKTARKKPKPIPALKLKRVPPPPAPKAVKRVKRAKRKKPSIWR